MKELEKNKSSNFISLIGLVGMAGAILWWFSYYAQWQGPFELLDVKLGCLMASPFECTNFQEFIGASAIPPYHPAAWYVGLGLLLVGIMRARRKS